MDGDGRSGLLYGGGRNGVDGTEAGNDVEGTEYDGRGGGIGRNKADDSTGRCCDCDAL